MYFAEGTWTLVPDGWVPSAPKVCLSFSRGADYNLHQYQYGWQCGIIFITNTLFCFIPIGAGHVKLSVLSKNKSFTTSPYWWLRYINKLKTMLQASASTDGMQVKTIVEQLNLRWSTEWKRLFWVSWVWDRHDIIMPGIIIRGHEIELFDFFPSVDFPFSKCFLIKWGLTPNKMMNVLFYLSIHDVLEKRDGPHSDVDWPIDLFWAVNFLQSLFRDGLMFMSNINV